MKIINTFAIVEGSLFSVHFEQEEFNEHRKCFNLWNDPIWLREYFENHKEHLSNPFWKGISIEDAILKTRKDALQLEEILLEIAETGKTERLENLSTIFEPLSKNVFDKELERDKAKGPLKPSWLRIYAIRLGHNLFVITGSGIKLTKTMNEDELLIYELKKLEFVRDYLNDEDNLELDFTEIY